MNKNRVTPESHPSGILSIPDKSGDVFLMPLVDQFVLLDCPAVAELETAW